LFGLTGGFQSFGSGRLFGFTGFTGGFQSCGNGGLFGFTGLLGGMFAREAGIDGSYCGSCALIASSRARRPE
jgi:hypothetical protein